MRSAITTFALLALGVSSAFADLTFTMKQTKDGGAPENAVSYISAERVRMSQPEGSDILFDLTTGDMTVIDRNKKQYWVMTKSDWDAIAAKMKEVSNSPEMKNLPPEVREKMQAMMGGMMAVNVEKTGNKRKVAGYNCDEYTVTIGQFSKTTECVTNELKLPTNVWARYTEFRDRLKTIASAMGPMAKNIESMQEQLKKVQGFPIQSTTTVSIMGRTSTSTSELESVKEGAIPASAWQIPAGYTKVDSPASKALRSR